MIGTKCGLVRPRATRGKGGRQGVEGGRGAKVCAAGHQQGANLEQSSTYVSCSRPSAAHNLHDERTLLEIFGRSLGDLRRAVPIRLILAHHQTNQFRRRQLYPGSHVFRRSRVVTRAGLRPARLAWRRDWRPDGAFAGRPIMKPLLYAASTDAQSRASIPGARTTVTSCGEDRGECSQQK